ncbi:MAG TPA: hypothetical protein VMY78_00780 [Solirubrobacteraceae bacterium]|nr:hypothetical protein [Solirubrobacteraceae bacterium]
MRRAALLAVVAAVLAVSPATAQHVAGHETGPSAARVQIGFAAVSPLRVDVVSGESVTWTNGSARAHTVTADDVSFDSGRLASTTTFTHRFDATGEAPYHCKLHPTIRGVVAVHDLLLQPPPGAASPGRSFVLSGRASSALAAGTAVSLQADSGSGSGFGEVASVPLEDDGSFTASFVPTATATYRAVAGGLESPPVQLLVLDRRVTVATTRTKGGGMSLRTTVTPASPRQHVVLQLFLPERFGWWPVRKARLDGHSSASFAIRTKRRLRARVVLTLPDDATRLAISRTVRVGPRSP